MIQQDEFRDRLDILLDFADKVAPMKRIDWQLLVLENETRILLDEKVLGGISPQEQAQLMAMLERVRIWRESQRPGGLKEPAPWESPVFIESPGRQQKDLFREQQEGFSPPYPIHPGTWCGALAGSKRNDD